MSTDLGKWNYAREGRQVKVENVRPGEWIASASWAMEWLPDESRPPLGADWVELTWQGYGATSEEALAALAEQNLPTHPDEEEDW